jgi:hypothetical protein
MGLLTGHDGRRWCAGGARYHTRGVKRYYETIDEAWHEAFIQSAIYGEVMTPYCCLPNKATKSEVRTIPHPNPWAFKPWLSRMVKRDLRQRRRCGGYHLTRTPLGYILPP